MRVTAAVKEFLQPGDCVGLDGGDFVRWARWTFGGGPYEFLTNGKLGALGPGIPLAFAATLAKPDARSVCFVGDGTFGFHAMEFDTAVRHNLPAVVIVGNDAGWATERHRQREVYGPDRLVAADLLPTRYDLRRREPRRPRRVRRAPRAARPGPGAGVRQRQASLHQRQHRQHPRPVRLVASDFAHARRGRLWEGHGLVV